jgi:hypothetical protein
VIADHERGGRRCDYECIEPGPVVCRKQRCLVLPAGTTPDAGAD